MSEPQPSALTMKPSEGVHHGMCLPLHSGAVDANAFAESSSLSSASPDSMRSLSSLSGARTDSPLDVEMPEGTMGRKVTTGEDDSGIQSPDCRAENDNDNSVSVYLDANEEGWCEIHDDQDNVTLVLTLKQDQRDDRSDGHSNVDHGRRSSDDSSATEAVLCCSGYEEEDDEEEDSFLSLSSADVVMRCQNEEGQIQISSMGPNVDPVSELHKEALQESVEQDQMQSSSRRPSVDPLSEFHQAGLQELMESHTGEGQMQNSSRRPDVGLVSELHQKTLHESMEVDTVESEVHNSTRRPDMGHESELGQEDLQESMEIHTLPVVSEDNFVASAPTQEPKKTVSSISRHKNDKTKLTLQNTKDRPGQSHARPTTKPSMTKSVKTEIKRFPRPDLKNVKPKINSRAASAPRPANPSHSAAGTEKKPSPPRGRTANSKDQDTDGVIKKRRSSSNQARVTMPAPITDPKPKAIHLQTERAPPCLSDANVSPEIVVNGDQDKGAEVMDIVIEEREWDKEKVPLETQSAEETPEDLDQTGSELKTPKAAEGNLPTGVRAPGPAGDPKTCSPASSCRAPQKPVSSKLPIKSRGLTASLSSSSLGSAASESNTPGGRGVAQVVKSEEKAVRSSSTSQGKPANNRPAVGLRNRANSTPAKPTTAGENTLTHRYHKDPHMVYLEQELESLKVVLDIKTSQLHQQDKKLMQMDKLMESNVKLEECLKKLQQENEDYKARMDKHAALSRQLSTEQAMLQQTLQMESKVNKRLSMENEELLWKLHNGDLSSPRRLSPTSPFHSPRNSASFPSAPISPR
ncbi:hypothetical protein MHYP_G00250930 [Metynnis hypsauchen]